jgi:hypothetical protein
VNWNANRNKVSQCMFNLGQALPLTSVRFSCCAHRRAQLRRDVATRDGNAAIGVALNANRICKPSRQHCQSYLVTQCCVGATRRAAWNDFHPLPVT